MSALPVGRGLSRPAACCSEQVRSDTDEFRDAFECPGSLSRTTRRSCGSAKRGPRSSSKTPGRPRTLGQPAAVRWR